MGEQSNCQDVERHFSCIETLSKVWFEDKWDLERKMSSNRVRFSINFIFLSRSHFIQWNKCALQKVQKWATNDEN